MKAAIIEAPNQPLVVADLDVLPPQEGEVLVKVAAGGICHSDLHAIRGEIAAPLPVVGGHEGSGVVVEVGAGVTNVKPGDHVVLLWRASCGKCYYCTRGRPALCELGAKVRWTGKLRDGTSRFRRGGQEINHFAGVSSFGEYSVLLADAVIPIRGDVPLEKAALVGCAVLTGVGAVTRTVQVAPGDSVVVIGTGGVGLNVIQGAMLAGAERIIAIDIRDNKLEYAMAFGATHTVNSAKVDAVQAVRDLTEGRGADYAFEAIGTGPTTAQALAVIRRGGSAVIIGQPPAGVEVGVEVQQLVLQEKSLVGSLYGTTVPQRDVPLLLNLYTAGKLKLDELITREYPIEDINEAFAALQRGEVARSIIRFG